MAELIRFLGEILEWVVDFVVWAALTVYELFLEGVLAVLEAIPVPEWLSGADPFASIDPGVVFFIDALQVPEGIAIVLGAYLLRFLIRRIPVIG